MEIVFEKRIDRGQKTKQIGRKGVKARAKSKPKKAKKKRAKRELTTKRRHPVQPIRQLGNKEIL